MFGVIRGNKSQMWTYEDNPFMFSVSLIICIVFVVFALIFGGHNIDNKVKQFGGKYNLNTFKAMARDAFKKGN